MFTPVLPSSSVSLESSHRRTSPEAGECSSSSPPLVGRLLLGLVAAHSTFVADSYDALIRTRKGSSEAVQMAYKVNLALTYADNPNSSHSPFFTPLSNAIIHDRPWLFKKLLSHPKIDVDQTPKMGWPTIYHAIMKGKMPVLRELLKHKAKVSRSALALAAKSGQPQVLEALIPQAAEKISSEDKTRLRNKVLSQKNLIERLKWFVRNGQDYPRLDFNSKSLEENTDRLAAAIRVEHDVNRRYEGGNTMLHLAARQNEKIASNLIHFLLNVGAAPDIRNLQGNTPLMIAARQKNKAVISLLVEAGADWRRAKGLIPLSFLKMRKQKPLQAFHFAE